jgi:hypothetical protein
MLYALPSVFLSGGGAECEGRAERAPSPATMHTRRGSFRRRHGRGRWRAARPLSGRSARYSSQAGTASVWAPDIGEARRCRLLEPTPERDVVAGGIVLSGSDRLL